MIFLLHNANFLAILVTAFKENLKKPPTTKRKEFYYEKTNNYLTISFNPIWLL